MNHIFNISEAKNYGLEEAILLYNIRFWIEKNKANGKHFYENNYWTYNSTKAFSELFPYMSRASIERKLSKLQDLGVILKGNFNKKRYDRTNWYALPQNVDIHSLKMSNGTPQNEQPIPDVTQDVTTDTSQAEPEVQKESLKTKINNEEVNYVLATFQRLGLNVDLVMFRKNQREACQNIYQKKGLAKLEQLLTYYNQRKQDKFCPDLSSPLKVEENWERFVQYLNKI